MFVDNPEQVGAHFFQLSRAGVAASKAGTVAAVTVSGQEARTLLHPVIAAAALGDLERGRLDVAVSQAFKRLEVEARSRSGVSQHGKRVFYDSMGEGRILTPSPMDTNEALSLREVFAGAYGAFRNPPTHRDVYDDPVQVMRILIMASALYEELEKLPLHEAGAPPEP